MKVRFIAAVAVALVFVGVSSAHAQVDYRNLDDDRPVRTEDAYPVERYAFELLLAWRLESEGVGQSHQFTPEVAYGLFDNLQVGVKAPVAFADEGGATDRGLAGLRSFALYNFNTESRILPALAVRVDVAPPIGSLAGDRTRVGVKAIATRSFGLTRLHLNIARRLGSDAGDAGFHPLSRWAGSLALDRTFFRQSLLVIGEVAMLQATEGAPTAIDASAGIRYQWRPTYVWDAGVTRRLRQGIGPDYAITLGLSHAFAVRGLMPARP